MSLRSVAFSVFVILAFGSGLPAGEPPTEDGIAAFHWLVGVWLGEMGGATIEEIWLQPAGDSMLGMNRTVAGKQMVGFEYLRLEVREDGVYYLASPGGRHPATPFKLIEIADNRAVFANPEHDFPQRIIYRRDGDVLHARIEGTENGEEKAAKWQWRKSTL